MTVKAGARFGAYDIVGLLGARGMGKVEPGCERQRSGSEQAKSRAQRGVSC
jgi:hypothetical protein